MAAELGSRREAAADRLGGQDLPALGCGDKAGRQVSPSDIYSTYVYMSM